eukprot:1160066-Pelagomonas_calceolata.AAC.5
MEQILLNAWCALCAESVSCQLGTCMCRVFLVYRRSLMIPHVIPTEHAASHMLTLLGMQARSPAACLFGSPPPALKIVSVALNAAACLCLQNTCFAGVAGAFSLTVRPSPPAPKLDCLLSHLPAGACACNSALAFTTRCFAGVACALNKATFLPSCLVGSFGLHACTVHASISACMSCPCADNPSTQSPAHTLGCVT